MEKLKTLVIGFGYWGPNIVRNILNNEKFELMGIIDSNPESRKLASLKYPDIEVSKSFNKINLKNIDCAVISTPAETHFEVAKELISQEINLLIEKPMALSTKEANELKNLAESNNVKIMVGHTYLFHPAVIELKKIINKNKLGKIYYLYFERLNLGQIRQDINVMWNLAPHDISIALFLLEKKIVSYDANGMSFIQKDMFDYVNISLEFEDNLHVHINNSWLHPLKSRKIIVVGSEAMAVFDDTEKEQPLSIYSKGVDWDSEIKLKKSQNARWDIIDGETFQPKVEKTEPLFNQIDNFADWVIKDIDMYSDSNFGIEVISILEKLQRKLDDKQTT